MKGPAERPLHVASPARRRHILRSDSAKYVRCGDFVDALKSHGRLTVGFIYLKLIFRFPEIDSKLSLYSKGCGSSPAILFDPETELNSTR